MLGAEPRQFRGGKWSVLPARKGKSRAKLGKAEARMALTTDWQSRHARHFSAKKGAGFG
jgi:hypothetical protein